MNVLDIVTVAALVGAFVALSVAIYYLVEARRMLNRAAAERAERRSREP